MAVRMYPPPPPLAHAPTLVADGLDPLSIARTATAWARSEMNFQPTADALRKAGLSDRWELTPDHLEK